MNKSILIFVSLGLILGLAACDVSLAGDITPPPGASAPIAQPTQAVIETEISIPTGIDLQAGAAWYVEKCQDCHGEQGLGDGIQADALGVQIPPIGVMEQAYQASPREWFRVVNDGRMDLLMPPFNGSMDTQDIWNVLGFVYGLGSDQAMLAAGEVVFSENCAACHGVRGEGGATPGAPSLRDPERMTALSLSEIVEKISTGNGNEAHAFANLLDIEQQQDLAVYVRSLFFGALEFETIADQPAADPIPEPVEETVEESGEEQAVEEETVSEAPVAENVVTGSVINRSGTGIPEGLEVALQGYSNYELTIELSAPVAEDGSFFIEDVVFEAESIYIAVVEYQGIFYPSAFYWAEGGDQGVVFEVEISDSTTDKSELVTSRMHIFFEWITPELVQVVHMVSVSNLGTETVYTPGETEPVLEFRIPEQASNLMFESGQLGDPYMPIDSGFGDPRPVSVGENAYEILFAYEMAYDNSLTWTLPIDMPTEIIAVFIEGDDLKLESDQLSAVPNQDLQGSVYQSMSVESLLEGDEITLEISGEVTLKQPEVGLDEPAGSFSDTSDVVVIVVGGLGLLLTGFGVWWYFRPVGDDEDAFDDLDTEALIDEIAALDDAFEAGEIDQAAYQDERKALKAQLRRLIDNQ
jgi:mono/diheme cytochrome c family protein